MALTVCNYCNHGNPADARFCNACGATLTLAPCPHCGAVNDVKSTHCYQCRGSLRESVPEPPAAELPAAAVPQPSPRRPATAVVATLVVAIVVFTAYYAYRHYAPDSVSATPAANTEAQGRSGLVQPVAPPVPVATPAVPVAATPTVPVAATPASAVVPAETAAPPHIPAATSQTERSAIRQPVEPPVATTGAAPVARARTNNPGKAGEAEPPRLEPCTEKVAALGLCTLKPTARQEAEAAVAAVPPGAVRPQTQNAGEPCSEAVTALGLCTQKSK